MATSNTVSLSEVLRNFAMGSGASRSSSLPPDPRQIGQIRLQPTVSPSAAPQTAAVDAPGLNINPTTQRPSRRSPRSQDRPSSGRRRRSRTRGRSGSRTTRRRGRSSRSHSRSRSRDRSRSYSGHRSRGHRRSRKPSGRSHPRRSKRSRSPSRGRSSSGGAESSSRRRTKKTKFKFDVNEQQVSFNKGLSNVLGNAKSSSNDHKVRVLLQQAIDDITQRNTGKLDDCFDVFVAFHRWHCQASKIGERWSTNSSFWFSIQPGTYILRAIIDGYRLPFTDYVPPYYFRNNLSAEMELQFVECEILSLLQKGSVRELVNPSPFINPLSVAHNGDKKVRAPTPMWLVNNMGGKPVRNYIRYKFNGGLCAVCVVSDYCCVRYCEVVYCTPDTHQCNFLKISIQGSRGLKKHRFLAQFFCHVDKKLKFSLSFDKI